MIKGELKNKCQGDWIFNFPDKEIDNMISDEDKLCKPRLAEIARGIIKDFDENNKKNDYEFLDYMKIGLWVHKNIKYDLNYAGMNYSSMEIYNMKAGVSHHFTQLSNALLYSLGFKVLCVNGYISEYNKEFKSDSFHVWSLVKINDKWYPFDSTLGIVSGKLPVTHIFDNYFV